MFPFYSVLGSSEAPLEALEVRDGPDSSPIVRFCGRKAEKDLERSRIRRFVQRPTGTAGRHHTAARGPRHSKSGSAHGSLAAVTANGEESDAPRVPRGSVSTQCVLEAELTKIEAGREQVRGPHGKTFACQGKREVRARAAPDVSRIERATAADRRRCRLARSRCRRRIVSLEGSPARNAQPARIAPQVGGATSPSPPTFCEVRSRFATYQNERTRLPPSPLPRKPPLQCGA